MGVSGNLVVPPSKRGQSDRRQEEQCSLGQKTKHAVLKAKREIEAPTTRADARSKGPISRAGRRHCPLIR